MGHAVLKCPLDLWLCREIVHVVRPKLIIEPGTFAGGSGLYLPSIYDLVNTGRVVTIDVEGRPSHPRITNIAGRMDSQHT